MIYTSANSHLGDIAWFCHVLCRIPGDHTFYCPVEHWWQIAEMLEGYDVELRDVNQSPPGALNVWIACGRFEPHVQYANNIDMVEYLMRWDNALFKEAEQSKSDNDFDRRPEDREDWWAPQFSERKDLLFDFPAIRRNVVAPEFDILVVNSPPLSGQCPGWDQVEMDCLISDLSFKHRVLTTNSTPVCLANNTISASICNIGNLSLRAKLVVAVASGAHWCVWNPWRTCPVYLFLDPQRLDYGTPIPHAANVGEMRDLLKEWL